MLASLTCTKRLGHTARQQARRARPPRRLLRWLTGYPPQPYAPNTKLCGALILPSLTVPKGFHTLRISGEKEIFFFAVYPLYAEEMELKMHAGLDALLERFDRAKIRDVVDLSRENVARERFGPF